MLVAKEKVKSNVGEYIIYMFQIEDLIRACKFEKECIANNLVAQYKVEEPMRKEIENWYLGLAELMEEEKVKESGHLNFLKNKIDEINEFHLFLLQSKDHDDYKKQYKDTELALQEFAAKQKEKINNVVSLLANAIYSYYLLKLKKHNVSKETTEAVGHFSQLLNALSKKFNEYETGKLKVFED